MVSVVECCRCCSCLQDVWRRLKADERFGRVGAIVRERQLLFFIDKEEAALGNKASTLLCLVGICTYNKLGKDSAATLPKMCTS